jgi:hypothetical protein
MPNTGHGILTTHVGSLPRSQTVTDVIFARERGEARDTAQDLVEFPNLLRKLAARGATAVEPDIDYMKLQSLVQGAQIASRRLSA